MPPTTPPQTPPPPPSAAAGSLPAWPGIGAWLPHGAIVLLALLPALSLLSHEFVLDGILIIRDNPAVHTLAAPWQLFAREYWPPPYSAGLYRPLSSLLFAVEWSLGGGSPALFHGVSIMLYAALCLTVYRLTRLLLPPLGAWASAALFAVHPVHTEAVASAVNQSELIVALLLTMATIRYLTARRTGGPAPRQTGALLALYLAAMFTKEHAVIMPALLLAVELTAVSRGCAWRQRFREAGPFYLAAGVAAAIFIALRTAVLGGNPIGSYAADALVGQGIGARLLTMLAVVPEWARLLFWPSHLQADYGPREIVAAGGWGPGQTAGLLLTGLLILALVRSWRGRPVAALALLWIAMALGPVHNVLVPTGVVLAERTLLLASLGATLLAGVAVSMALSRTRGTTTRSARVAVATVLGALLALGAWRSARRYPAWRSQYTLARRTASDAPLSYRAHFMYGEVLDRLNRRQEAEREYRAATLLVPGGIAKGSAVARRAARAYEGLGNLYGRSGLCGPAVEAWRNALDQAASVEYNEVRRSLIACLLYLGEYRRAAAEARIGIAGGWRPERYRGMLRTADSALAVGAPPGSVRISLE